MASDDVSSEGARAYLALIHKLEAERDALKAAMTKISDIRDSITGSQTINWSEHIYPLVAVLNAAGFEGQGHEIGKTNFGTLLQQRDKAEAENTQLREFAGELLDEITPSRVLLARAAALNVKGAKS